MFSKVISFFDKSSRKSKKFDSFDKIKNYDNKSMEWQDDDDDRGSIDSLSWVGRNALEKSKSDSSITAIRDCNYRTLGTQVSLETCDTPKHVTSVLENLDLNDDNDIYDDEKDPNYVPVVRRDYNYQFDYNLLHYRFRTQDVTTKQLVIQGPEILNFQGTRHLPEEIAPCWKKDCRTWLWKSIRYAKRQNEMQTSTIINL